MIFEKNFRKNCSIIKKKNAAINMRFQKCMKMSLKISVDPIIVYNKLHVRISDHLYPKIYVQ